MKKLLLKIAVVFILKCTSLQFGLLAEFELVDDLQLEWWMTTFTTWVRRTGERNSISCLNEDVCLGWIGFQCLSWACLNCSIPFYHVSFCLCFVFKAAFGIASSSAAVDSTCSLTLGTCFSCSLSVLFLKLVHFPKVLAEGVKGQGESLVQSLTVCPT